MEPVVIDAGSKLLKAGFADSDDPPSTAARERLVQLMFETFNISGFHASWQPVLSLYTTGKATGCVVDIGHGKIDIATVIDGCLYHRASRRFEHGGIDLTNLLAQELGKSNPHVNLSIDDVERIKEQFSCCTEDQFAYENTNQFCQPEEHILPDGQVISIGRERFTVGEALFQPIILGIEATRIVDQLVGSISAVDPDNQRDLMRNTFLCGGTVSMTGFEYRFEREASIHPSSIRPALIEPPLYMFDDLTKFSAWVGGTILAKFLFVSTENDHRTKSDYHEYGPSIVHSKCF